MRGYQADRKFKPPRHRGSCHDAGGRRDGSRPSRTLRAGSRSRAAAAAGARRRCSAGHACSGTSEATARTATGPRSCGMRRTGVAVSPRGPCARRREAQAPASAHRRGGLAQPAHGSFALDLDVVTERLQRPDADHVRCVLGPAIEPAAQQVRTWHELPFAFRDRKTIIGPTMASAVPPRARRRDRGGAMGSRGGPRA